MNQQYIELLTTNWINLKTLQKLNEEEIMIYDEPYRMYLLCFYKYNNKFKEQNYTITNLYKYINEYFDMHIYFMAAFIGNIKIMKYLESRGMDINYKNNEDCNAYLCATINGQIKTIKYLESCGFDIYSKNISGYNMYLIAVSEGQIKTMKYLESRGINIYCENNFGHNAYLLAAFNDKLKIMKYLESKDYNVRFNIEYIKINSPVQKYIINNKHYKLNKNTLIYIN